MLSENYPFLKITSDALGQLQHFRVEKLIGEGGMGYVFEAIDTRLQRPVALKVLKPEGLSRNFGQERFLQEAQAIASIRHPNVVTIYHVDSENGFPFFAMELLPGETLAERLKSVGKFPLLKAISVTRQMLLGLEAAHNSNFIHRDIKPSNVWLQSPGDTVRLLDFGLARSDKSSHAQPGLLVGTPRYVSPEQVRSEPVDARSDLYSVGVTMYEMLSGQLPHDEPSASLQLAAIVAKRPKKLSELCPKLPTEITTIVDQLLEKKAELRPNSARELLEVLEQFKPPKRRALVQRRKRNKWLQLVTELRVWFLIGCLLVPGYLGYMLTNSWLFPAGVIGELAEASSLPLELTQPLPPVASAASERRSYISGEDGQGVFAVGKTEARRGDYVNMSYQPTYVRETPVFEFEIEEDWGAKQCIDATLSFTLKGGATSSGERTVFVYGIEMESEKLLSQKNLEELIGSQEATELGVWQFNNRGYRKNGVVDGLRFSSKKLIDFIRNRNGSKLVFWLWRKDQSNGQTHFYSDVAQPDRLPKLWVELAGAKIDTASEAK